MLRSGGGGGGPLSKSSFFAPYLVCMSRIASTPREWIAQVWLNMIRRALGLPTVKLPFENLPAAPAFSELRFSTHGLSTDELNGYIMARDSIWSVFVFVGQKGASRRPRVKWLSYC